MYSTVIPASYGFLTEAGVSVNGSSATGNCSSFSNVVVVDCTDPTSSVLYDGHIPTLTGLDGDMWASQLLTLHTRNLVIDITFHFSDTQDFMEVEGVEVVMFNCPEWGAGIQTILLLDQLGTVLAIFSPNITSCDSLVTVDLALPARSTTNQVLILQLASLLDSDWVHLAEVTFYDNSSNTSPPDTSDTTITHLLAEASTTPAVPAGMECPSCLTSTLLASVLTAIITALLATAIFLPVLVAVCKCHPNFTPGGAETGTPAGEGEGQEYEQIDVCNGGVATSDPTYMEVGEVSKTFQLQQNEAYATGTLQS